MIFQDKYILYKALFSSLFYMCAHVGEMVISFTPQNTLQYDDIKFTKQGGGLLDT